MLAKLYKIQRYNHHKTFQKPNHSHPKDDTAGGSPNTGSREIKVVRRVLDVNDAIAQQNRELFAQKGVFVINVMSSPGSGKTTTLEKTLSYLMPEFRCAVIVGDICTSNDADRLAGDGAPVVQVNTDVFGGDCHLTAHVIQTAVSSFELAEIDLLIVENLGNLVCPAEFDLGEDVRVVILSVTEGEDKPVKYPLMFRVCEATLLNKIDLLPYSEFDLEAFCKAVKGINQKAEIFQVSCTTGQGIEDWVSWITASIRL